MRLQLAIPENTLLKPEFFNRLLSLYGETAIFLFALPLVIGLFYYLVPLQIGARSTALPRIGQLGFWLWVAGGGDPLRDAWSSPRPRPGVNPLPPLSNVTFSSSNGADVWLTSAGLSCLGFVLISIDLIATLRNHRAPRASPGGGCRRSPGRERSAAGC